MSYDVSLKLADSGGTEHGLSGVAPSDDGRVRLERLLARLRALDPSALIEEVREQGVLRGFTVVEARRLPYIEAGPQGGMLSMSLGSDPVDLYRALHTASEPLVESGYTLFDHQLGEALRPATRFEEFMQQFRSQWDTEAAFEHWMRQVGSSPRGIARTPTGPAPGQSRLVPVIILLLVLIWGAYKLHKAGYF